MADILISVFSGLIVNAVSSAASLARRVVSPRLDDDAKPPIKAADTHTLVIPAINRLRQGLDNSSITKVSVFLRSPESVVLFRHYLQTTVADQVTERESQLKEQLAAYLYLCCNMNHPTAMKSSGVLNPLFVDLARETIAMLDRQSQLGYDLREGAWRHPTVDDLASLARTSEFLNLLTPQQVANIVRFETLYRSQVCARHRLISPPSWDSKRQVPIDSIYVAPKLIEARPHRDLTEGRSQKDRTTYNPHEIATSCHRAVILGNPGAGKSTLITKLMYDFSQDRLRYIKSAPTISFKVILRDYVARKYDDGTSLLEYISTNVESEYMVDPPAYAIEYYLMTGRAAVLFDGLDELVMTHQRQEMIEDIHTFANRYASSPVIVTSREVGYHAAPLAEDIFEEYRLSDFEEAQVEEYIDKWFSMPSELSSIESSELGDAFLNESESVSDLRVNPLMLTILCNLYRGERHIPENRVEVYRRCSVMLFERWDKDRGIKITLPFASHIRYAIGYLAEWMYSNQQEQGGVPEPTLVAKTVEYLKDRVFDSEEEAESAAREFVSFCKGRAWVLTEIGDGLYQFSHRTFLEYFTALGVTRRTHNGEQFWHIFMPKLSRSEWDMVGQLALALFDETHDGGADDVLKRLIGDLDILSVQAASTLLQWALRSMAAVVPSAVIRRKIARAILQQTLSSYENGFEGSLEIPVGDLPSIPQVAEDNLSSMTDFLMEGLEAELAVDNQRASRAGRVLLKLPDLASLPTIRSRQKVEKMWKERSLIAQENNRTRLITLARTDLALGIAAYHAHLVNIEALISWHGLIAVFARLHATGVGDPSEAAAEHSLSAGDIHIITWKSVMRFLLQLLHILKRMKLCQRSICRSRIPWLARCAVDRESILRRRLQPPDMSALVLIG